MEGLKGIEDQIGMIGRGEYFQMLLNFFLYFFSK